MITYQSVYLLFLMSIFHLSNEIPYYDDYFISPSDSEGGSQNKMVAPEYSDAEAIEKPTGYICTLCIVVDEEFSTAYNIKEATALKKSIQKFIDHANWVFRSTDWSNNGKPDNIGFKAVKMSYGWKPYKHETSAHYETPKPALQLLKIFARLNFSKCCLGVGFTNRPFSYGLDGISFGASDRLLGGICDHRNPNEDFMINMNVMLISGRGLNQSQLTSYQVARAFLHELGHAFGVHVHDNEYKNPECWGFRSGGTVDPSAIPRDGRYIMWAKSPQANVPMKLKRNTLKFSSCSKASVLSIISKRKNRQKCFELDYNPFCGNGIVEAMEMCDCGNEYDCSLQKCCGSRKSEQACVYDTKNCGSLNPQRGIETGSSSKPSPSFPIFMAMYVVIKVVQK